MSDFVFDSLHNDEELPLGGRVLWLNDRTLRLKMLLYPAAMQDVPERVIWNPGPPSGAEVKAEEGGCCVLLGDKPLSLQIIRGGRTLFNALVTEFSRKNRRIVLQIDTNANTRFYGLGGQFLSVEHSGREIECQSTDPWGEQHLHQLPGRTPTTPFPGFGPQTDMRFSSTLPFRSNSLFPQKEKQRAAIVSKSRLQRWMSP